MWDTLSYKTFELKKYAIVQYNVFNNLSSALKLELKKLIRVKERVKGIKLVSSETS